MDFRLAYDRMAYGLSRVRRAVRLMQQAITRRLRGSAGDVFDIFRPVASFRRGDTQCRASPVCSVAQEVVQWATYRLRSPMRSWPMRQGSSRGGSLMSPRRHQCVRLPVPWTALEVGWRRYENRPQAFKSYLMSAQHHLRELRLFTRTCRRLQSAPGVDLYAARRIPDRRICARSWTILSHQTAMQRVCSSTATGGSGVTMA